MTHRKRKYVRKYKFNKTYKGKYTQRELTSRIKIVRTLLICFLIIGIYQYVAITTNTIKIDGNAVMMENVLNTFDETSTAIFVSPPVGETTSIEISSARVSLTEKQIRHLADKYNFRWPDYLVNLACCEGLLKTDTTNDKGNTPNYSIDRGLYGINDFWHSEISNDCAFDLHCSTLWTMKRINEGYQYEWMCDKKIKGIKNYAKIHCKK